jgi:hypothetical protein
MIFASRRAMMIAAITLSVPASIFVACGSNTFSSDDADGATVTPQNDASSGDALSPSDAGDAGTLPPTWCQTNAPTAFFCADFDEGDFTKAYDQGVLKTMFTPTIVDGGVAGVTIGLGDAGSSSPDALRVVLPSLNNLLGESALIATQYKNAAGATSFQLDFDIRNEVVGSGTAQALTFQLDDKNHPGTVFGRVEINVLGPKASTLTYASSGGSVVDGVTFGAEPTVDLWTHVQISIQPGGLVSAQIGTSPLFDAGSSGIYPTTTEPQLTFGLSCSDFSAPLCGMQISIDNIVLQAPGADGG